MTKIENIIKAIGLKEESFTTEEASTLTDIAAAYCRGKRDAYRDILNLLKEEFIADFEKRTKGVSDGNEQEEPDFETGTSKFDMRE